MLHFTAEFAGLTGILAGVCIAFYGWGLTAHRISKRPAENPAMTIAVGLAVVVFLGGVLNLLRIAYGGVLDGLLIAGFALAVTGDSPGLKLPRNKSDWGQALFLFIAIAVIMGLTVETQLHPGVFNYHDDFEKYFSHPVRMLQTGTLFGSPLAALGSETLGGQAVLHGMVLRHFPISYINGADAVFGLFLCLILSVSVTPLRAVFLPIALICPILVFSINQQYVNVSALYTAVALMMTSILMPASPPGDKTGSMDTLPSPLLMGLLYAALISLKSTFAVFPPLHLIFFVMALAAFGSDFRRALRCGFAVAGMTSLFLSPWILLHLPHYIHMFTGTASGMTGGPGISGRFPDLLSAHPVLLYGASFAHYTFIALAIILSVLGVIFWKRGTRLAPEAAALAGLASGGGAIAAVYLLLIALGPVASGYSTNLRYTIPFLIAGAPILLSRVYLWAIRDESIRFKLFFSIVPVLSGILIVISFSDTLAARIRQGKEIGSILAFSKLAGDPEYIGYNREVLYGGTEQRIRSAQNYIPAGAAVVAWITCPFYLDYRRNTIYNAEPAGLATPWAGLPDADYFMMEYRGGGVRSFDYFEKSSRYSAGHDRYIAGKCIEFMRTIAEVKKGSAVIYNDGGIVIFKKPGK